MNFPAMNLHAVKAIYLFEMARTWRTPMQSILSPVLSTLLYFIVFGAAIGQRFTEVDGVNYGAFIVPGVIMLSLLTQSIMNASFGIYFPRFTGTIYELLSAPVSPRPQPSSADARPFPNPSTWPTPTVEPHIQGSPWGSPLAGKNALDSCPG